MSISIRALGLALTLLVSCTPLAPATTPQLSGAGTPGPLVLQRVELSFRDGSVHATVPRNAKLRAKATVRFKGTGPFHAAWVVDGRAIELVAVPIGFGDTLTLETAPTTELPTFEPGIHEVTLQIRQPFPPFESPVIRYTVTAQDAPSPLRDAR